MLERKSIEARPRLFSSRPLIDRNNDPRPFINNDGMGRVYRSEFPDYDQWEISHGPAYQYGTLPENPILVKLRSYHGKGKSDIRISAEVMYWAVTVLGRSYGASPEQVAHGTRVLSLLATLTN